MKQNTKTPNSNPKLTGAHHVAFANRAFFHCTLILLFVAAMNAQQSVVSPATAVVPRLVNFSSEATNDEGKPVNGTVGMTFSIYNAQEGGAPLWMETQNVQTDARGNYTVQLGAASSEGLPLDLFATGEARWLGVRVNGGEEEPRILLLSVPYALKAADAQTLAGLPASAFMLAGPYGTTPQVATGSASSGPGAAPTVGGGGTQDYIPLWIDNNGDLGDSILYQSGTGSSAKIGINEKSPLFTLDVNGQELMRGLFEMATQNYATKSKAYNSQPLNLESSAFNSATGTYTLNHFQWQAEPTGNNTTTPGATLNLLYGTDPNQPAETGLNIASTGQIAFAKGQTFPGTGTITGVTTASGSGLSGGGTSGNLTLSLVNSCAKNQVLQWSGTAWACFSAGSGTITGVTAGTDLTGGGTSGSVTLNVDTTRVPQLNAANTFTGNQTVNGNLSATGTASAASFQIGNSLFAFGSYGNGNAFLGFAGSTTANQTTLDTAVGYQALSNDTGGFNTAIGSSALPSNTTGIFNTASGAVALFSNTGGTSNTASGASALFSNTSGSYNTAVGLNALYSNQIGNYNNAFGFGALNSNVSNYNDAFGYQALYASTASSPNNAFGTQTLFSNTSGADNDAFGYQALYSNTTGQSNDAFGYQALATNSTGVLNAAFGFTALTANTAGYGDTALGSESLIANTTGIFNTAVGGNAMLNNQTGNSLTCIGYACDTEKDGLSNATAIGAHAVVGQSNSLVLGGTDKWAVKVGIGTAAPSNILTIGRGAGHPVSDSWETYSSRRWKANIQTLPNALSKVEQLRGVSYDLKDSGKHEIGVIAEEVGQVLPEVVSYEKNGKDAAGVDYSRLTAVLIEAVKQQQREIETLRRQLQRRGAKEAALESRLERLERHTHGTQLASARPAP